jgi:CHAT domain-containing protein
VTLTELFTRRFDNQLVVISSCDSALGAQRGGEGMNSLTRGFISQGVLHVVSTLWEVSDQATADFMAIFYRELRERRSVARALQAAQLALRELGPYRDPYFWAPYQLTTVSPEDTLRLVSFGGRIVRPNVASAVGADNLK